MAITVEDFPSLTHDLQSIFNEVAKRKVAESKGMQIFDSFNTDRRTYNHLILHGSSGIKKVTPGEDLPRIHTREGDKISYTQSYYGGSMAVTKEMRLFELYNEMETLIKSLAQDSFDLVDQSMADRLIHGFDTYYRDPYNETVGNLGPDGESLFSASHTNPVTSETFSNLCREGGTYNPPLSRQAIVDTRKSARVHKDPNGIIRPINLDTLIVPPELEDLAERLIGSEYLPGSANNDKNPLYGKIKKVVVWERLQTASDGTDGSESWFLADSKSVSESLKAIFAERPSLDAPEQVYLNKNWEYTLDYFYVLGNGYPAYIFGSDASGTE